MLSVIMIEQIAGQHAESVGTIGVAAMVATLAVVVVMASVPVFTTMVLVMAMVAAAFMTSVITVATIMALAITVSAVTIAVAVVVPGQGLGGCAQGEQKRQCGYAETLWM